MRLPTKPGPGVYRKYLVKRLRDKEQKHRHCEFFVLDQMHDPFAIPALNAYANACEATHPELAADLRTKVAAMHGRIASGSMRSPYEPDAVSADSSRALPDDEHANDVVRARSLAIKLGRGPEVEDLVLAIIDVVRTEERAVCAKTLEDFLERHKSAEGLKLWPVRECLDRIRKGGG